jgi:nicotinate-nucleotide adenylyltransferase
MARHAPARAPRRSVAGRPQGLRTGLRLGRGLKVGLYGGSFDPVHHGHAHVAATALRRLGLDRVVWIVSPRNPLKSAGTPAPLVHRLAAVRSRARGPRAVVSDLERAIGMRYTIDTVRWLKARHPGVRFVWLMGADGLAGFHRWRGWTDLVREMPIAVVARPGHALRSRFSPLARRFGAARRPAARGLGLARLAPPAWLYLTARLHGVSSTALRKSRLTVTEGHDMSGA